MLDNLTPEELKAELVAAFAGPAPKYPPTRGPWWLDLDCANEMIESVVEYRNRQLNRVFRRNTAGTRKARARLGR